LAAIYDWLLTDDAAPARGSEESGDDQPTAAARLRALSAADHAAGGE
jgi:hypothetical protein